MAFQKILLVKPSGRSGLGYLMDQIPIGLEYVAAYIEDSVDEVHIIDMEMENRIFPDIVDKLCPDLIGISMSATEHNEGLLLAKVAKRREISTIVGGYHPTSVPNLLLSYPQIDMVVRGEGELTLSEIIANEGPENVMGVSYRNGGEIIINDDRSLIEDLDSLPFPARHLRKYLYKGNDRRTDYDVLLTSRGCYGKCTFCCEPSMSRSRYRYRSPKNIVKEILEIAKYHESRHVSVIIADPNFMGIPSRVERMCDLLRIKKDLNVEFCALVRPDNMANHPDIVKKMCEVGILYFEMGIESPNRKDLKSVRKGLSSNIHIKAVNNIRKYGGGAGGTFVIGLPDQTEEEIRYFPSYAKEIGMTAAAFGIVTPFPGTEFYKELDEKGLIFEKNWDNFDEMHSVYKNKNLTKEKIEELATFCMAKFWNIDTFIDREQVFQIRTGRKKHLLDFILERKNDLQFLGKAGKGLKKEGFERYVRIFLDAYADPRVKEYTQKVGVHNILEMTKFLRILGSQKIQLTLDLNNKSSISFILKTRKDAVDYIQIRGGRTKSPTIDFRLDFNSLKMGMNYSKIKMLKKVTEKSHFKGIIGSLRLLLAFTSEFLTWKFLRS